MNQTRTINCTVLRANPPYIRYSINGLSPSILRHVHANQHTFHYTFDIRPTSIEHFRSFNVTASNSVGFDKCTYQLIHGGKNDNKIEEHFSPIYKQKRIFHYLTKRNKIIKVETNFFQVKTIINSIVFVHHEYILSVANFFIFFDRSFFGFSLLCS